MKRVSILIPMYNAEAFVRETLESCVTQTYREIEIIVVDDGSKDGSLFVAKEFQFDVSVKLFHTENAGACVARNLALDKSTGEYVMFLDADNIISKNKVETQIKILERSGGENAVVTCPWDRFYKDKVEAEFPILNVYHSYDRGIDLLLDLWTNSEMFETACYMLSRKLAVKAGPWMPGLAKNQDGEYFARVLLNASQVIYCPEGQVYYRSGEYNSVSKESGKSKIEALLCSFRSYKINALAYEDSARVREALTRNFSLFMYLYYGRYSDLCQEAKREILDMNMKPLPSGTHRCRQISRVIGLENFLRLRKLILNR